MLEEIIENTLSTLTEAERVALFGIGGGVGMSALSRAFGAMTQAYLVTAGGESLVMGAGTAGATVIFPVVIAAALVWVAMGSGYYQARQIVKHENTMSGFSQGFVCGLLGWSYSAALDKFRMPLLMIDVWDEDNNRVRVDAYMDGLRKGFIAGHVITKPFAKNLLGKLRLIADVSQPSADAWAGNRLVQRNYVIELAGAARKHGLIKPDR